MSKQVNRWAICALALLIAVSWVGTSFAVTMGYHVGVGGDPFPPSGPYPVLPGATMPGAMVMGPDGGEIPLWMDPDGEAWTKIIQITTNSFPEPFLVPGQVIPVWEKILILPPPTGTTIPRLPFTDWHEQIVDIAGLPLDAFAWGGGELVVHNPNDPGNLPPLVVAPGMIDPTDPGSIWFGPWAPPLPVPPNGLPVWIHKQLIFRGTETTPIPTAGPIDIYIREWPTVPEPTTFVLVGLGCIAAAGLRRRR